MKREFIELPAFLDMWSKLGLTDDDLANLENYLCCNPVAGDIIPGTGGLRKIRCQSGGRGKSGGARVLYVDYAYYERIYFIGTYSKSDKISLSADEKKTIKEKLNILKREIRGKK